MIFGDGNAFLVLWGCRLQTSHLIIIRRYSRRCLFWNITRRWTLLRLQIAELEPAFLEEKYFHQLLHVPNLLILYRQPRHCLLYVTILGLDVQLYLDLLVILPLLLYLQVMICALLHALQLYAELPVSLLIELPLSLLPIDILDVNVLAIEEGLQELLILLIVRSFHGGLHLERVVLVLEGLHLVLKLLQLGLRGLPGLSFEPFLQL